MPVRKLLLSVVLWVCLADLVEACPRLTSGFGPDTLLTFRGRLTALSYLPLSNGGYVLAVCADTASVVGESRLLLLQSERPGLPVQKKLVASPDPQWPDIANVFPCMLPCVRWDRSTVSAHVFFAVSKLRGVPLDVGKVFEIPVSDTIGEPTFVLDPSTPAPVGFVGPLRTLGFGVVTGDQLAVHWQREDGLWCALRRYAGWSRPCLLVSTAADLGGGAARMPDVAIEGSTFWLSFKGYDIRDLGGEYPPLGWANALYWCFGRLAKGQADASWQLFWRAPDDLVEYTYLVADWRNRVFHVFGAASPGGTTFPNSIIYGAVLDDVVAVPPFKLEESQGVWIELQRPVLDAHGRVHCVYFAEDISSCPGPRALCYVQGCGRHWSSPSSIVERPAEALRIWEITGADIEVDEQDIVHVVWAELHSEETGDISYVLRRRWPAEEVTGVVVHAQQHPALMCVPFPNPANPFPSFRFVSPGPGALNLQVFDITGRRLLSVDTYLGASGETVLHTEPRVPATSGVYVFRARFEELGAARPVWVNGKFVVAR